MQATGRKQGGPSLHAGRRDGRTKAGSLQASLLNAGRQRSRAGRWMLGARPVAAGYKASKAELARISDMRW